MGDNDDLLSELRNVKYVVFEGGWLSRTVAQRAKDEIDNLEVRLSACRDLGERLLTERDTAFLEGVKAGIAEVRRVLDQCNDPCPTCYENLEAIDPATITPTEGGADGR